MSLFSRHRALACAFAGLIAAAAPSAAGEWRRLETPNFIVIGDASARDLARIAAQFESFRETLARVLSERATATAVPTVVIVFPDERAFRPFQRQFQGKPVESAGAFHGDRDYNYITLLNDGRAAGMRVVFHEYAHLVISNITMNLPAWLDEGLAEYYSTFELERDGREAFIGRPIEGHLHVLDRFLLLPVGELVRVDQSSPLYNEGQRRSVFYAQSWAVTHMLLGTPEGTTRLGAFIRHLDDGVPAEDAWRRTFDSVIVGRDLQLYLRRRIFGVQRYSFPEKLGTVETSPERLSEPDARAMLAALYLRQRRYDDAWRIAGEVLATSAGHQPASVVAARVEIERGELAAAAKRLESLGTIDDWFVAYSAGVTLAALVGRTRAGAEDEIRTARRHLDAVLRRREVPNVLAHLAMLELSSLDGAASQALAHISRARALAPGRDDYALIEGRALADLGEFEAARRTFTTLMRPGFPPHIRDPAREWLDNVARMESSWRRGIPRTSTGYRARRPGEQRIEGVLEGIVCPAAAPVEFHVRTGAGVEILIAPDFAAVQLITYRRDLRGKMICGPIDAKLPVFVTWKPAADGTRIVVAIEFLPATSGGP